MDHYSVESLNPLKRPNSADDEENLRLWDPLLSYKKKEDQINTLDDYEMFLLTQFPAGILNQTNGSTSQSPNTSMAPVLTKSFSSLSATGTDRFEKKRKIDKQYRERLKNNKMQMQMNLENLTGENGSLKEENQSLKEDNASMNQILTDQAKEIDQLKSDLLRLKHDHEKQNVLLQTLSGLLSDPLRLENEKLKDENASLRKNANLNSNLPQLLEENARLKIENKVLKVQNDALCGKIIGENEKRALS